jgi:hypothetical protein
MVSEELDVPLPQQMLTQRVHWLDVVDMAYVSLQTLGALVDPSV